jgi:CRP-like cAMP-binding protein
VYETLAGVPMHRSARVVQRTQALRIEREDFFDVMSQHPALPRHLLGALFRELSNARQTPPGPQVAAPYST